MPRTVRLVLVVACLGTRAWAGEETGAPVIYRDQARQIVARIMADASDRSSLTADQGAFGHDGKGFSIRSSDSELSTRVQGMAQFRYFMSVRESTGADF